jgi:hypothetical protein
MAFSSASTQAANDARVDRLDTGTGNPTVVVYTASFASALITFDLDGTNAFGNSTDACPSVATATGLPISATASATGTAASYRILDRDDTVEFESSTLAGLTLSDTSVVSGGDYNLTTLTISTPCS